MAVQSPLTACRTNPATCDALNKGLAGGSFDAIAVTRDTAMNPEVCDAFVPAIIGGEAPPAFPDLTGHAPNLVAGHRDAAGVKLAMSELKLLAPSGRLLLRRERLLRSQLAASLLGVELSAPARREAEVRSRRTVRGPPRRRERGLD